MPKRMLWGDAFSYGLEYFFYGACFGIIGGIVYLIAHFFEGGYSETGLFLAWLIWSLAATGIYVKLIADGVIYGLTTYGSSISSPNKFQTSNPVNVKFVSRTADPNSSNVTVKCRHCGTSNSPANIFCTTCTEKLNFR